MDTALDSKKALRKQRKEAKRAKKDALAKALQEQPLRKINLQGLQRLQQSLALLPSNQECLDIIDALFIAIDFEYSHFCAKTGSIRLREVGISTLDTRDIPYKRPEKLISSQHFRTVTDTKPFLFGTSVDIEQNELVLLLKQLLLPEVLDYKQARKLILVGHGFSFEIQALRGLGINLAFAPTIETIFDTHYLGLEVFNQDLSLSSLTRKTGVYSSYFHNAGNDAGFTLRCMFLLAIHGLLDSSQKQRVERYKQIARF
jgi:hypothetical protein